MKQTLTYKDICEIPTLLSSFDRINQTFPDFLKSSDEFFLVGRGSSGNATLFAKYIWESYCGKISNIVHPFSVFNLKKRFNMKGRVVFSFSQSGRSYDVVECSKRLKEMGAKVVAVTNEPDLKKNALGRLSHHHILLSYSPEIPVAATKSFILQLWAVLRVADFMGANFKERSFKKTIDEADKVINCFDSYLKKVDVDVLIKSRVVGFVGRGPYNAVCEDAALKFREISSIQSLGFSAAEFLHGPVGAFSSCDCVVLLLRGLRLTQDIKAVIEKLKEKKVRYLIIKPFSDNYPFNAIGVDIFLKLLSLYIACQKGLDPDKPQGLSKITHTF